MAPFLLSSMYVGETPSLPMIDLALSKEKAVAPQFWGLLYDGWAPNPEEEGVSVFMQGYEKRGPNNERKKIYVSAVTPDLIATKYRPKLVRFYERMLADSNAGKPLMGCYFDNYYDLYWDLHVAATGDAIPNEVRHSAPVSKAFLGSSTQRPMWCGTITCKRVQRARHSRNGCKLACRRSSTARFKTPTAPSCTTG
jgi:hypothetical protein